MSDHPSRRDFLTSWLHNLRGVSRAANPVKRPIDPETALRPPGALSPDERFLEACTGCGECAPACPAEAIVMVNVDGDRRLPAIRPATQPCLLCTDLPCISSCPDSALDELAEARLVRLGIARVDPRRCITFQGQLCTRCFDICPYPHDAIMMIGGRPLVGSGACTGCGLCEKACPENPKAIRVIAERLLVPGLRIPKNEIHGG